MDELFGEVGFAAADEKLKARIEREVGLTALLGEDDGVERENALDEKESGNEGEMKEGETK